MSVVPAILLAVDADGIATLTLNRPDQLNAFDLEMVDAWRAALEQAEADERVKVIVVTGAGRAFCAGGDFEEMAKFSEMDSMGRKDFLYRHVHRIALTLERMEKPVIAAVNGAARGAGCDMALMCDIRLMASSATLAESYINIGLMAGDAGAWYLPRLIGTARALELFWTGRVVGAEEADRIGMVNRVVPDAELTGERLAQGIRAALALTDPVATVPIAVDGAARSAEILGGLALRQRADQTSIT